MEILELIKEHCLCIRQIPDCVISKYTATVIKPGDTVVTENGRKFRVSKRIPKYAGYWMCKQVLNTDSQVHWSLKLDNLAATLEESVAMCMSKIPPKI